jgi:hypothetical protein
MTNNQKIMLYVGIAVVTSVAVFFVYKAKKNRTPSQDDRARRPDGTLVPIIPDWVIDEGIAKQDARLAAKKALFEAQWKKSGSKMSFKDWYIENAT